MSVRENDSNYRAFMAQFTKLHDVKVAVGVFEADGQIDAGDGTTLIEVAVINEFGGGHVPSRSFLRAWFDENKERAQKALMLLVQQELKKSPAEQKIKQAVEKFGLWLQGEIQKRIAQGIPPANAPSTIAKKGSSKPLIDKGQLRSSITFAIDWGTGQLKVKKSEATKKREDAAKAEARAARKAERRKEVLRRRARRQAIRQLKKDAQKGVKNARKQVSRTAKNARKQVRQVTKSAVRNARKGGKTFLRKAKRAVRKAKRKLR